MTRLKLKRETLRELEPRDLRNAQGGIQWTPVIKTLPLDQCVVIVIPTAGGECIPA